MFACQILFLQVKKEFPLLQHLLLCSTHLSFTVGKQAGIPNGWSEIMSRKAAPSFGHQVDHQVQMDAQPCFLGGFTSALKGVQPLQVACAIKTLQYKLQDLFLPTTLAFGNGVMCRICGCHYMFGHPAMGSPARVCEKNYCLFLPKTGWGDQQWCKSPAPMFKLQLLELLFVCQVAIRPWHNHGLF